MADETEHNPKVNDSPPHQPTTPFIELLCKPSGKTLRFAPGTKAGFALTFANDKLHQIQSESKTHLPFSSHIESVKDGEDPIVFGPTATLLDFGHGWKLVAVADYEPVKEKKVVDKGLFNDAYMKKTGSNKEISGFYLLKILLSFVLIFLFGALCTFFLENLPQLILYIRQLT